MSEKICDWCGDRFTPRQDTQRFCQLSCNHAWNNEAARRGREVLRSGATTFAQLAAGALGDELGGRFAIERPKPRMTAFSEGAPLPVADWNRDPVPAEPPFGVDINEVPDLGFPEGQRHE